ncbi:MAG TPA: TRC40/GET3/ArsA family transport-energizing ATPase [Bryobacteraceae bacterium]|nr:TRC40/GET3/ArsA family transport-energizing ATPase [Bryobacteraceae bacterium]
MRILLFSGKGGVGKTSIAAATGVHLARLGKRTLILSVDPAHSLADAFDLGGALFHGNTADPLPIGEGLSLQEVNINHEVKKHWKEISAYVTTLLRTTGIQGVEAEEMAIFPGMEELSAMMYINSYRRKSDYDVIVLDCAPTAESLRFVSLPTTLGWYIKHIFGFQRNMLKALRPLANRLAPVELPPDSYFRNIKDLFDKVEGMDKVLEDASMTSVRLVTNPEKMVLRETQRAFVYFTMHGLTVDAIIANRVLPVEAEGTFFEGWRRSQQETLKEIEQYFAPVPVRQVPLFPREVLGSARLEELAARLYAPDEDPSVISRNETPYQFVKNGDGYQVRITMPFTEKAEIGLFKKQDELVVEVGTVRRHVGLPTTMAALQPVKARLDGSVLVVDMRETL